MREFIGPQKTVVKTKSVEYMPFFLSFFLFLNAGVWSAYAVLVKDFFIGVPNAIGFLLGSAQLIIYTIYKNKSKTTKYMEEREEEGSAHLKGSVEMRVYEDDDNATIKNPNLTKGRSLPKTTVARQHSFQKILKTFSVIPNEFHSIRPSEDSDIEHGDDHQP